MRGKFTSANVAKFVQLPCLPKYFKIVNTTQFNSTTQDKVKEAFGYDDETAGRAYIDYNGAASSVVNKTVITAGGFTFIEAGTPTFGAQATYTAGTPVNQANPAVVTAASHGFQTGDAIWITGTTGMLQIAGIPYTITRIDANSFSIRVNSSGFAAAATSVTLKRLHYADLYIPMLCYPTAITQASSAVVTLNVDHQFVVGSVVKFVIPSQWGMIELNNQTGTVTAITSSTITVNIDTTSYTAFSYPTSAVAAAGMDFPQVIPIADENFGYVYTGSDPLNRVLGSFVANTRQGVLVGVGNGTQVMHTTNDVIKWEAEFPDFYQS